MDSDRLTPAEEIRAVLAEHAPHLVADWDATLRLYRTPNFLRARADDIEQRSTER